MKTRIAPKSAAFVLSAVFVSFALGVNIAQAAPGPSCSSLFSPAADSRSHALDPAISDWADLSLTRFKPLSHLVVANMLKERVAIVVAGGSSVHTVLPKVDSQGRAVDSVSAKLYFKAPGPQSFSELTRTLVDAALPSLLLIASHGAGQAVGQSVGQSPAVLVIPAPGKIVQGGRAIELPANFGVIGRQVYELPRLVQEELARRHPELAATKIVVKNDSFTLAATIGSDRSALPGRRVKLVFAGTGLGETSIATLKNGVFLERATESGHLKLSDYDGLSKLLSPAFVRAAEIVRVAHDGEQAAAQIEFENFVAGGRPQHHLSGLLSVLVSARLNESETPEWIRRGAGSKKFLLKAEAIKFRLNSQHPADLALVQRLGATGSLSLEHLSHAADQGGPMAQAILKEITYTQGLFTGILATEFGSAPAGESLPAHFAFGGLSSHRIERDIEVRADGALLAWAQLLPEAQRGVDVGVNYQFLVNTKYLEKLRAAGIDPKWTKQFRMIYGSKNAALADADLQGLATLSRKNFE